jgi:hypothetical protein
MSDYCRQTYVFERASPSKAIRYVCYEDLRTGQFCVSGGDILHAREHAETLSFQAVIEVNHFMKDGVSCWFDTLLEAIEDFAPVMETDRSS